MKRILVIEDDASVRENICEMLQMEGYDAIGACNGQEGIYKATTEKYDLIVCDIMMPVVDGMAVLTHIRNHPLTLSIPFIFLTAKTEHEDQRIGMDLGADDYLTKPFTRLELLNSVKTRLERKLDLQYDAVASQTNLNNNKILTLPLEFSNPLQTIKDLADHLISIRKVDEISHIIQIGQQLDQTTRDLTRITQKYLLLGDLEKRLNNPSKIPPNNVFTNQADAIFLEILVDYLGEIGTTASVMELQPFICVLDPEDYFKFCELVIFDMVKDIKPSTPVSVLGRYLDRGDGYQLNIRYTSTKQPFTTASILSMEEENRSQELSISQRIAALLNSRFEISKLNDQVEIRIIFPAK